MGRGDLGMSEPGLDRDEVDARPQELHRQRVPEDVRRHADAAKRSVFDSPPENVSRPEPGEALAPSTNKDGLMFGRADAAFAAKAAKDLSEIGGKRDDALLSTFPMKEDLARLLEP